MRDPDECDFIAESIKIHSEHLSVTKYGQMFVIASCIYPEFDSKFSIVDGSDRSADSREEFVYERTQKLFGHYSFGVVHILIVVCRSRSQQKMLSRQTQLDEEEDQEALKRKQTYASAQGPHRLGSLTGASASNLEIDERPLNFCFSVIENTLLWVNFE